MPETLQALGKDPEFSVEVVDTDQKPELYQRYNRQVPVPALNEREISQYLLDKVALLKALGKPI